jgi:uncharacterized repeat protein (TIGR03803 family)
MVAVFLSHFALVGIGSLAFTAFTPQATLVAPGITLKGSFDGTNGAGRYAALTSAGNGNFYGTIFLGGANNNGTIFEFDPGANNVPAPLPVIGAGAAFGRSRRLRRRIQHARPVVQMGR